MDVVNLVAGKNVYAIRNEVLIFGLGLFGTHRDDFELIAHPHGFQGVFQFDDMVPIAVDQQMGTEISPQLGHSAFHDMAFTLLDGAAKFLDHIQLIGSCDSDDKLHEVELSRKGNGYKFTTFCSEFPLCVAHGDPSI